MHEVSGPVVGIALILAAVFIPVGLMGGIQGRLNQQFAITIAVSVLISAFNALTLSPALSAMLLRPRKAESRAGSARLFGGVNRWLERTTRGYVSLSHGLIRKPLIGVAHCWRSSRSPPAVLGTSTADQLPARGGLRLLPAEHPAAAGGVARSHRCGGAQGGRDPAADRGRRQLQHHRRLQPAHARHGLQQRLLFRAARSRGPSAHEPAHAGARSIVNRLNGALRSVVPEAVAFAVMPPAIPGLGIAGRLLALAPGSRRQLDRGGRRRSCRDSSPRRASGPSLPA